MSRVISTNLAELSGGLYDSWESLAESELSRGVSLYALRADLMYALPTFFEERQEALLLLDDVMRARLFIMQSIEFGDVSDVDNTVLCGLDYLDSNSEILDDESLAEMIAEVLSFAKSVRINFAN